MTFEEWLLTDAIHDGTLRHAWEAGKAEGAREEREACAKLCKDIADNALSKMTCKPDDGLLDAFLGHHAASAMKCEMEIRARGEGETLAN